MKGKNMILLSVAVLAIGLFVLPQTMAMFMGQHTWYSVRTSESQYELCQKCHVNEVAEWRANTGAHATYNADHPGCFCHQVNETALTEFGLTDAMAPGAYGMNFEHWNETGDVTGTGEDSTPRWSRSKILILLTTRSGTRPRMLTTPTTTQRAWRVTHIHT